MKKLLFYISIYLTVIAVSFIILGSVVFTIDKSGKAENSPDTTARAVISDESGLYRTMDAGSSKKLQGTCVFINVFVSNKVYFIREKDKELKLQTLHEAVEYIYQQAEKYGQSLSIIYDTEDTNIDCTVDYAIPLGPSDLESWPYETFIEEIRSKYDIDGIMKKYDADNLSFLIHFDTLGFGVDFALMSRKIGNYINRYYESAMLYTETYEVFAHEILHLFGAIDLYKLDEERLALAEEYFPDEIMLSNIEEDYEIGALTAYLIGWTGKLDEKYKVFLK